ncbi:hypothetical protein [Sulfurovum riftiae]|uniref:Uncharacterized protein n=1 Tax=Sulfurovum riftiae TaxID=1630136 RepID=A0A151CGI7_9BACT|nr:hypothetical protein [Sulfurovum riftiae]KYJ86650.1 hypothetical protein AS592_00090 [Sulfurovum riftiae]
MTKRLISVAAMVAIMGTGAQAFDTNTTGDILTRTGQAGNYVGGTPSTYGLRVSTNKSGDRLKGDALIFPAFDMQNDWGTEIIFRNEIKDNSVVAKVVLYAADDSRELIDFNVYLSDKDQFRFTIKDGVVKSTDGSVAISENFQTDDVTFASEENPFEVKVLDPITQKTVETGYVIVYGMMQTAESYHNNHEGLFKRYRSVLDNSRDGWRTAHMTLGVYDDAEHSVPAPNVDRPKRDVAPTALSGTERIFNASGETRDLLLNPTPLMNFTYGNAIVWAPGEYAAIADRNIEESDDGVSRYNADKVLLDTDTFLVNSTTYVYNNANGNVDNKFIITQPTKRFMVQLGMGSEYWINACEDTSPDAANIETGLAWGFRGELTVLDENEKSYEEEIGGGIITSPANSSSQSAHCKEITTLGSEDLEGQAGEFANGNGFIHYEMTTGKAEGIPAIITQMSANRVGGNGEINWVYSPATKQQPN